jgi:hypothetical protein
MIQRRLESPQSVADLALQQVKRALEVDVVLVQDIGHHRINLVLLSFSFSSPVALLLGLDARVDLVELESHQLFKDPQSSLCFLDQLDFKESVLPLHLLLLHLKLLREPGLHDPALPLVHRPFSLAPVRVCHLTLCVLRSRHEVFSQESHHLHSLRHLLDTLCLNRFGDVFPYLE